MSWVQRRKKKTKLTKKLHPFFEWQNLGHQNFHAVKIIQKKDPISMWQLLWKEIRQLLNRKFYNHFVLFFVLMLLFFCFTPHFIQFRHLKNWKQKHNSSLYSYGIYTNNNKKMLLYVDAIPLIHNLIFILTT